MANGNGNGNGLPVPPWKIVGLAVTVALGISGITMTLLSDRLSEHGEEIAELSAQLAKGERYTEADAARDFNNVDKRMDRIEMSDAECARRINDHVKRHPQ